MGISVPGAVPRRLGDDSGGVLAVATGNDFPQDHFRRSINQHRLINGVEFKREDRGRKNWPVSTVSDRK